MAIDAHANFGVSSVAVAPSPSTTGTSLTVAAGEGTRFPAVPFNATLAPAGVLATPANAEIVRVIARGGDVLTITRAQEGTVARAVVVGDLCVASITAKAFQDIETGFAQLAAVNYFRATQRFEHASPGFRLSDTSQPVDARMFRIYVASQQLNFDAATDADTLLTTAFFLTRTGDAKFSHDLYEKARTTPLGHWISVPYNAANFTSAGGPGTWIVEAGDYVTCQYTLIGKLLIFVLSLTATSITPAPVAELYASLPAGVTLIGSASGQTFSYDENGASGIGAALASPNEQRIKLRKNQIGSINWATAASTTSIQGIFTLPIA